MPDWLPRALLLVLLVSFAGIRTVFERQWDKGRTRQGVHDRREHALTVGVAMSQLVCCWTWISGDALAFADLPLPAWLRLAGFGLGLLGIALFWWVHATLGRNFSPRLDLRADHVLVTSGPYAYVRHPMYTVSLALIVAYGLLSGNWMLLLVPGLFMSLLVAIRLPDEEAMMLQRFGPQWQAWAARTGRLLPRLRSS